jgi:hypothetical protein
MISRYCPVINSLVLLVNMLKPLIFFFQLLVLLVTNMLKPLIFSVFVRIHLHRSFIFRTTIL